MKGKIFRNNLLVGILIMVLCALLFAFVLFRYYQDRAFDQLDAEAAAIAAGTELSGETYLDALDGQDRVTWVDTDGTVLYDSEADPAEMQNHLDREEIAEAMEKGQGESSRWSETLLEYNLYSALRLDDGSVIRVSCTQSSVLALLLRLVWPVLIILAVAVLLCVLLSYRLARQIVKPINEIDLDHPMVDRKYSELRPLVDRIREQNRTIRGQMEELTRKQQEFSALTDNMCEGFLLLDDDMHVLSGNAAALRVLGRDRELQDLRRDCVFPAAVTAAEEALTGTRSEAVQELEDGVWQIIADPIEINDQVAGAAMLLVDVTEQEQRERLRREFSANVSHELKTPLTSISGFAELISQGMVSQEKTQEFAGDIYREARRLLGLVDDIIRLSRLDEGAVFETETVDLYDLCAEFIADLAPAAEGRNVTISQEGSHVSVTGARQLLGDLVFNLLDNAVQYNRDGGSVTVETGTADGHPFITVSDTGTGIPYGEQSRVFERFYRGDKSRSRQGGGTGLGLSIVKHAAQYHHADVALSSVPDEGTTVTVTF
ncbi:MAG: ATP-binding protein [Oscillospiraceae bacterium]|nr:ATP-binding protein [Oscillospiraceae bacterium]